MKKIVLLLIAYILASQAPAHAFTPENGLWINPDESGYTFSIEIQDTFLYIIAYAYTDDADRTPTWVAAQGNMQSQRAFLAPVYTRTGGTCVGCPFSTPNPAFATGQMLSIEFLSETSANLTWAGRTIPIERFNYFLSRPAESPLRPQALLLLLGQWQVVIDQSNRIGAEPFQGDVLSFDQVVNVQPLGERAMGCRPNNTTNGRCNPSTDRAQISALLPADRDTVVIIAGSDPNGAWLVYEVTLALDRFSGVAKRCRPDAGDLFRGCVDNTSVFAMPVRGWRSANRSMIQGDDDAPNINP